MSKGNPPIPVRMTPEHRDRWQAAASKAGMDFTTWVRQSLDIAAGFTPGGHARVPISDRDTVEAQARRILGQHLPEPALDLPPIPQPSGLGCAHPKDRRERKPYGTICGVCRQLIT